MRRSHRKVTSADVAFLQEHREEGRGWGFGGGELGPLVPPPTITQKARNQPTDSAEDPIKKAIYDELQVAIYGGGGNCTRVPDFATNSGTCGYGNRSYPWSEMGREAESLREVIDNWPSLPPHIVQAILTLVRAAKGQGVDAE